VVINENAKRKIIPVASGKGGVGKTFLVSNLSIALAENGKDAVAVDLDLGGSNLHTFLGIKNTSFGVGNFLCRKRMSFQELVVPTAYDKLRFVPGDALVSGLSTIQFAQKKRIVDGILSIDAEYIIIDLGSGANSTILDFFLISNSGFIVTFPQTTSILNAYSFLKSLLFRFFLRAFSEQNEIIRYLKSVMKEKSPGSSAPMSEILRKITRIDRKAGEKAENYLKILQPKIVVNMAEMPDDLLIVNKLRDLIHESLSLDVECMGVVYSDSAVDRALAENKPLAEFERGSIAYRDIERISQKIIQSDKFPQMPLDLSYYKDSFELALIEAQNDWEELQAHERSKEEVDAGDLIALMSAQRRKISELQGIIRNLTMGRG
jgi:flagellar biosynthesis protein FlhG